LLISLNAHNEYFTNVLNYTYYNHETNCFNNTPLYQWFSEAVIRMLKIVALCTHYDIDRFIINYSNINKIYNNKTHKINKAIHTTKAIQVMCSNSSSIINEYQINLKII